MASFSAWLKSFRPSSLALSFASVFTGVGIAFACGNFNFLIAILTLLTAFLIHLLSNITNDLGDYLKGTDNSNEEVGGNRMMSIGKITFAEMRKAIIITLILTILFGSALIIYSFIGYNIINHIIFFILGFISITAAVHYTLGKNAYGYKGLGDFFAFLFFGPVGVFGSFYLQTKSITLIPLLPSLAIGFLTTAVLTINNIRDYKNDKNYSKNTLAVKIGLKKTKIYLVILFILAHISLILFTLIHSIRPIAYIYTIVFLWQYIILNKTLKSYGKELNKRLQSTVISTCLLMVIFIITLNL